LLLFTVFHVFCAFFARKLYFMHKDICNKKSIGMHHGTFRGSLSAHYEDITEPPKRWKEACEELGLTWGEDIGVCDIGETVAV
jgi:N-acyl-phosphatidylethanolamine-hydrolysing phospholipase D